MPQKQTKFFFILLILLDICSIALFFSLFFMMQKKVASTIDQENQIKTNINKEESLSLMKKDIEAGQAYESKLYNYVIGRDDVVGFIKTLENIVATSHLKSEVNSVSYESSGDISSIGAEYVRVKMNVTGEWKNIQFFLTLLENYPLKIDVKNVSLNTFSDNATKGKKIPEWSGNFEFTVVKLKEI